MATSYKDRKFSVLPYDPEWGKSYIEESNKIRNVFGEGIAIEHIGSTSVPGLYSKPTIDILVLVKEISFADKVVSGMKKSGYEDMGEYVTKKSHLFVKENNGERLFNVHVFEENHPHVKEMLAMRDYLRNNNDAVREYGDLKKELFEKHHNDYGSYRRIKDEYLNRLKDKINQ